MKLYKRDFFISRIRAGYIPVIIGGVRLTMHHPNTDIALCSQEKYIQAYEEAQEEGLMTDEDVVNYLIQQDIWSEKKEDEYNNIVPGHIEYWKIELYNSTLKSNTKKKVRKYLDVAKTEYDRLHQIRHFYDYVSDSGYANYVKSMYLIAECTRINGERVDWQQYNLTSVMGAYHETMLSADDVRYLARTTPWTSLWSTLQATGKVFDGELTAEQQALISWSIMFDKIYESPDCPPDYIIEDDDMLDGWLLVQKKQREADKKKQEVDGVLNNKISNADEIYIPTETHEDAKKIDLLNPPQINTIKKQRMRLIKDKGTVQQQEFKDVQLKRSMQMQQAFNQQVKGG